jgi:hypothetical protein
MNQLASGKPDAVRFPRFPSARQGLCGWTADRKDDLEAALNRLVCAGSLSLAEAQQAIASNWIEAYRRYVGGV